MPGYAYAVSASLHSESHLVITHLKSILIHCSHLCHELRIFSTRSKAHSRLAAFPPLYHLALTSAGLLSYFNDIAPAHLTGYIPPGRQLCKYRGNHYVADFGNLHLLLSFTDINLVAHRENGESPTSKR